MPVCHRQKGFDGMLISKFSMQMPKLPTAPTLARLLVLLFILLWTAAALSYVYRGVLDSISRDEWRFIDILHHWYDGQFSLADIWSTNTAGSEHRTPGFKLYFLANTLWFGLDVRLGCYIGVLSLGLFALLMFRYFIRVRDGAESRAATAFDYYAFLPVALTMFSFTQSHIYAYDLLAEFAVRPAMDADGSALAYAAARLALSRVRPDTRLPVVVLRRGQGSGPGTGDAAAGHTARATGPGRLA
jgi:hypothetical protein